MRVYVDAVMGISFLVDLLLLLGTNRLTGFPSNGKRLLAAALLGGLYSGVCLLPDFRFLGNILWRLVCLVLMGSIAYGWSSSALRRCGVFLLLSLALGGLAVCLGRGDFLSLLLSAVGLWILCRLSFDAAPGSRTYIPVEIIHGDRSVKLLALRDTGNMLCDPITGQQALVIAPSAAFRLTGLTVQELKHPLETIINSPIPGLRLIPFRTVGQGQGMMLAMTFETVLMEGKKKKALVAFSAENFDRGSAFQALTGGVVSC